MERKERERKERELDSVVREWKDAQAVGNEGRAMSLYMNSYLLAMEIYDDGKTDRSMALIEKCLNGYDPQGGEFSHYMNYTIARRRMDWNASDEFNDGPRVEQPVSEDDGNDLKLEDVLADEGVQECVEPSERLNAKEMELTSMVLNFSKNHSGRRNNPTRKQWYRLFYTEDMTMICKISIPRFLHERDMLAAMEIPYLDYYMSATCRSFADIRRTHLKPLCETTPPSADTAETPIPLPTDVSLCYMLKQTGKKPGRNTRSEFLKPYKEEKYAISV